MFSGIDVKNSFTILEFEALMSFSSELRIEN